MKNISEKQKTPAMFTSMVVVGMMVISCGGNEQADQNANASSTIHADDHSEQSNKRVAVLLTDGFHDGEAYMPIGYLANHGAKITVIGPKAGFSKAYNSDFEISVDRAIGDVSVDEFDVLVIPGGESPAKLREDDKVIEFVKNYNDTGKPIAAICHGPQVLAKAGLLQGRTITSVDKVKDEVTEAGANYKDEALVEDGNLITSRVPEDLSKFSKAIADKL